MKYMQFRTTELGRQRKFLETRPTFLVDEKELELLRNWSCLRKGLFYRGGLERLVKVKEESVSRLCSVGEEEKNSSKYYPGQISAKILKYGASKHNRVRRQDVVLILCFQ